MNAKVQSHNSKWILWAKSNPFDQDYLWRLSLWEKPNWIAKKKIRKCAMYDRLVHRNLELFQPEVSLSKPKPKKKTHTHTIQQCQWQHSISMATDYSILAHDGIEQWTTFNPPTIFVVVKIE